MLTKLTKKKPLVELKDLFEKRKYTECIPLADEILGEGVQNYKVSELGDIYFYKAFSLRSTGQYQKSLNFLDALPDLFKNDLRFLYTHAENLCCLEDFIKALETYEQCLKKKEDKSLFRGKAECLRMTEEFSEALTFFDKSLKIDSKFILALAGKASVLRQMNQMKEAHNLIEQVLKLDPKYAFALGEKGLIEETNNNLELACKSLSDCLEFETISTYKTHLSEQKKFKAALERIKDRLKPAPIKPKLSVTVEYNMKKMSIDIDFSQKREQIINSIKAKLSITDDVIVDFYDNKWISLLEESHLHKTINIRIANVPKQMVLLEVEIDREVSSGHYGTVYRGIMGGVQPVALKGLKFDDVFSIQEEANIWSQLNSPFVVHFYGLHFRDGRMYLCMEWLHLGSLKQFLPSIENLENRYDILVDMAKTAVNGLIYLEKLNIVHRDIDQNKETQKYLLKIADFGLSRKRHNQDYIQTREVDLPPIPWTAPEIIQLFKAKKQLSFSERTDVWSFGVTMWEMIWFGAKSEGSDYEDLKDMPDSVPEKIKEIITFCLNNDATKRPSFKEISKKLEVFNPPRAVLKKKEGYINPHEVYEDPL